MADWMSLGFIFTMLGFLLIVLAMAGASKELTGAGGAVEALEISGFLSFLMTFVLTALVQYGQVDSQREVNIANVVFSFLTGQYVSPGDARYTCYRNSIYKNSVHEPRSHSVTRAFQSE